MIDMTIGNTVSHDVLYLAGTFGNAEGKRSYYEIDGYQDGTVKIVGKVVNGVRVELTEDEKNGIPQIGKSDTQVGKGEVE